MDGTPRARGSSWSEMAMINGVVTSNQVLWHAGTILRHYGLRRYLRCLRAIFWRRNATFLEVIWGD
jgi:hypothetical protein